MATRLQRLREMLQGDDGPPRNFHPTDNSGLVRTACAGCGNWAAKGCNNIKHHDDCVWLHIDAILAEPDPEEGDREVGGHAHRCVSCPQHFVCYNDAKVEGCPDTCGPCGQ